jgi:hypothetical protein
MFWSPFHVFIVICSRDQAYNELRKNPDIITQSVYYHFVFADEMALKILRNVVY